MRKVGQPRSILEKIPAQAELERGTLEIIFPGESILLAAEGDHGIDLHGSSCGQITGQQRDCNQEQG
jgi:hypothetical protein